MIIILSIEIYLKQYSIKMYWYQPLSGKRMIIMSDSTAGSIQD